MKRADPAAAADFLARLVEDWPRDTWLNLCAIPAQGGGDPIGRSWPVGEVARKAAEIAAWIAEHNRQRHGVYFTPNPLRRAVHGKPRERDIAAVAVLAVDLDPPPSIGGDDSYAARRAAVLAAAEAIRQDATPPTVVIDSGNGLAVLFGLDEPTANIGAAEEACRALHRALGRLHRLKTDGTHNPSHLMRLPGTLNWPTGQKLKQGYPNAPSITRVLDLRPQARAALRALSEAADRWMCEADANNVPAARAKADAARPSSTEDREIRDATKRLLGEWPTLSQATTTDDLPEELQARVFASRGAMHRWQGHTDGLTNSSSSGMAMALTGCLKAAGCDLLDIAQVLLVYEHGDVQNLDKHPTKEDQARAIARAWVRSVAKPRQEAERAGLPAEVPPDTPHPVPLEEAERDLGRVLEEWRARAAASARAVAARVAARAQAAATEKTLAETWRAWITPDQQRDLLEELKAGWDRGEPYRLKGTHGPAPARKHSAVHLAARTMGVGTQEAEAIISGLITRGFLTEDGFRDGHKSGLKVVAPEYTWRDLE